MNNLSSKQIDQRLIQATLDGNCEAFGELIRKYQNRLYNGLVQMLRSESDAEDVVQEAFILAFTKLSSFKGNSAFFTWLYRIGYNVAITKMRRRKPSVSLESKEGETQIQLPGNDPSPEADLERQEQTNQLMEALGQLSEEHRSILILREIEEMEYDAISEILDLPIGTVRSRLHRARSYLKQHLELIMNQ